jgi:hypothetical protein
MLKPTVTKSETGQELQICYGEVYAPNRPDADGEFMTAESIRKMAHGFLREGRMAQIDVMHDNKVAKGCSVVESFIAPEDDKTFLPGSWVVGVHVPDPDLWGLIKKGTLNGFSMEALVNKEEMEVELDIPPVVRGRTSSPFGDADVVVKGEADHNHEFFVTYDAEGKFRGGVTNFVNGHSHRILAGTHTEKSEGHLHRFSAVDNVAIRMGGV